MGMGERKLRAKQSTQTTAEAGEKEIHEPNLFSEKPVESDLTIECMREPEDSAVVVDDAVLLIDMKEEIGVFKKMKPIGCVVASQVDTLRATLELAERKGRSIPGRVIQVSEITPTFIVHVRGRN